MTIHIQSLQVQNLGPIESRQETLGQVNLFYGLNESGKTYLVEFLLQSLFRHAKNWDLRGKTGRGSVLIKGLDQEPVTFSPESSRKIEDYWDESGSGLPLNMARLLVVKGAELALSADSPGGVGRDTLRSALTSQALLDQIWETIPTTVRGASLEGQTILGNNRGQIKTHNEIEEEIREIARLLEQIEDHYSQGPAAEIEEALEASRQSLDIQNRAKRHLAYQTWQRLTDLNQNRDLLNKKDLQDLRDAIRDHKSLDRDIDALRSKLGADQNESKEYPWLQSALEIWESKGLERKVSPPPYQGIAGFASLVIGAVLMALKDLVGIPELQWAGAGVSALGVALSLYFLLQVLRWRDQAGESAERKAIQDEYEKKFNAPLHSLAELRTRKSILQEAHAAAQATQALLDEKAGQRKYQSQAIEEAFIRLTGKAAAEKNWQGRLTDLTKDSERLDSEIIEAKLQLSNLNVPQDDFYDKAVETQYDPESSQALEEEIKHLVSRLDALHEQLNTLKARACERTGKDINQPWREVLFSLQTLLAERIRAFKEIKAELIAKIGLTDVLTRLRDEEDLKIIQAINRESLSTILHKITGRYQKLDLVDDQLIVQDSFSSYALSDLSTGAREQVQLALRLGIASQICGGNPLFLILDDAFQHSDWQRRRALVQSTLDLARSGWQILYLTMDDHVRDLFLKEVKPALKDGFKLIQLD